MKHIVFRILRIEASGGALALAFGTPVSMACVGPVGLWVPWSWPRTAVGEGKNTGVFPDAEHPAPGQQVRGGGSDSP